MADTVRTTTSIDEVLQNAVSRGDVPGVVAMAANEDGPIYEGAAGVRSTEADDPITADTMLRIASMTKMVTTTAALQLVEQGSLDLDEPVAKYRPEFAEIQVLEGFDGDTPKLRAPASQATVRHLVTHTSGLGYWFFNADIDRYEQVTGLPNVLPGSNEMFKAPLDRRSRRRGSSTGSTPTGSGASSRRSAGSRSPTTSTSTSPARSA